MVRQRPTGAPSAGLHGFSVLCLLGEILLGALAMGTTVLLLTASGHLAPNG